MPHPRNDRSEEIETLNGSDPTHVASDQSLGYETQLPMHVETIVVETNGEPSAPVSDDPTATIDVKPSAPVSDGQTATIYAEPSAPDSTDPTATIGVKPSAPVSDDRTARFDSAQESESNASIDSPRFETRRPPSRTRPWRRPRHSTNLWRQSRSTRATNPGRASRAPKSPRPRPMDRVAARASWKPWRWRRSRSIPPPRAHGRRVCRSAMPGGRIRRGDLAVSDDQAARQRRFGRSLPRARSRTQSRGRAQTDSRPPCRRFAQPRPLHDRSRSHRLLGTSGDRAGL